MVSRSREERMIMISIQEPVSTKVLWMSALILLASAGFSMAQAQTAEPGEAPAVATAETTSPETPLAPDRVWTASWNFDAVPVGKLPAGWKVEATNLREDLPTWKVMEDETAPSGNRVLVMSSPNHTFGGTFNLCWTDSVSFLDGTIEVSFKAFHGEEDQGGGIIWRVQDKDNYYISRFNPLENNFRIYYVRDGARKTLADARVELSQGQWHKLTIVQRGKHFQGYLDGKKLLQGKDELFTKPGGVGLWTKADAVTAFDDFQVESPHVRPETPHERQGH